MSLLVTSFPNNISSYVWKSELEIDSFGVGVLDSENDVCLLVNT
jgi:hypothetical protein